MDTRPPSCIICDNTHGITHCRNETEFLIKLFRTDFNSDRYEPEDGLDLEMQDLNFCTSCCNKMNSIRATYDKFYSMKERLLNFQVGITKQLQLCVSHSESQSNQVRAELLERLVLSPNEAKAQTETKKNMHSLEKVKAEIIERNAEISNSFSEELILPQSSTGESQDESRSDTQPQCKEFTVSLGERVVPLKCTQGNCKSTFDSSTALSIHKKLHRKVEIAARFSKPIQEEQDETSNDQFLTRDDLRAAQKSLHTLTFPTKCTMAGCSSTYIFNCHRFLRRHLSDVHFKHLRNPVYKTKDDGEIGSRQAARAAIQNLSYPARCPVPACSSPKNYICKSFLQAHIRRSHFLIKEARNLEAFEYVESEELRSELLASRSLLYPTKCAREDCPYDTVFRTKWNLQKHIQQVHSKLSQSVSQTGTQESKAEENTCEHCGRVFRFYRSLVSHKLMHEEKSGQFKCEDCGRPFSQQHALAAHRKRIHSNHSPAFFCVYCRKAFTTKQYLQHHTIRHTGKYRHFCRSCHKGFIFQQKAEEHERKVHWIELGLQQIKCDVCGKTFASGRNLVLHRSIHTGEKNFACKECDYRTPHKNVLKDHVRNAHRDY